MDVKDIIRSVARSSSQKVELVRYVMVGGVSTVLQYVFYVALVELAGMSALAGAPVSYGISFCVNFILSNYFTFHTRPNKKNAASFAASHIINLGLQTLLVAMFTGVVGKAYALLPAMLICIPINYLLVRFALTNRRFQKSSD